MPHGLGHLLGMDTHDVGGFTPSSPPSSIPGLRYLRTTRTLEEGMCITVEPGMSLHCRMRLIQLSFFWCVPLFVPVGVDRHFVFDCMLERKCPLQCSSDHLALAWL